MAGSFTYLSTLISGTKCVFEHVAASGQPNPRELPGEL
jgi:hypothetical protein